MAGNSHIKIARMVATCRGNLRQTLIHVPGFRTLCQWNLDSGFPSLVRVFQIPWAVFWIPKSRIPVHKQKFHPLRNPESLTWSVDGATARRLLNSVGLRVFWVQDLWSQKSWALEAGIQLKESGIPLTIGIWNPSSLTRIPSLIQYLKSRIHSVKSRIQDSLTLPFMGRKILLLTHCPISLKTQKLKAFSTFQGMTSTCTRQISIYLLMMSLIWAMLVMWMDSN